MEDRRLAAIMFTDIVGYTALMGSDEKKAFEVLRKNRNIQKPIIRKYRGKWLKEMGDGILASFSTATDAVLCAGEIQNQVKKEGIELRIGIHLGEVVFQEGDVLGDGVNVASRLEEIAEAGCIYISGAIYKNVKNKEGIKTEFIGEKSLKNVDEPVRIYMVECEERVTEPLVKEKQKKLNARVFYYLFAGLIVIIIGGLIWYKLPKRPVGEIEKSIAVLPFKNIGGSNDNQILCDGMLDEILNKLEHISDLNVLSRTSIEKYQNASLDIKEISEELNADNILEGSVRMMGDNFRVIVQLIHAKTGYHLWSSEFDGTLSDTIFIVQSRIAEQIATNLNVAITQSEKQQLEKIPTINYEAFEKHTQGQNLLRKFWKYHDPEDLKMAEKLFKESLEIDPKFVFSFSNLANVYIQKGDWDSVNYCADKIFAYDSTFTWGYIQKGRYFRHLGNYEKAIELFKESLIINTNLAWGYVEIGITYYGRLQDYISGIPYLNKAIELQIKQRNLNETAIAYLAGAYWAIGDYEKAYQYTKKSLEINPLCDIAYTYCYITGIIFDWKTAIHSADSIFNTLRCADSAKSYNTLKHYCYYRLSDFSKAEIYFNKSIESGYIPDVGDSVTLAFIYGKLGRENEAVELMNISQKTIEHMIQENKYSQGYDLAYLYLNLSCLHLMLNEKEKALNNLNKVEEYEPVIFNLLEKDPAFEKLHDDPEFKALLKRAKDKKAALRAQVKEMEERGELNL